MNDASSKNTTKIIITITALRPFCNTDPEEAVCFHAAALRKNRWIMLENTKQKGFSAEGEIFAAGCFSFGKTPNYAGRRLAPARRRRDRPGVFLFGQPYANADSGREKSPCHLRSGVQGVLLKCDEGRQSGFFTGLWSKTAGTATLFQGFSDN